MKKELPILIIYEEIPKMAILERWYTSDPVNEQNKKLCQEWGSNPRLYTETRTPNTTLTVFERK